jgi:hypothetical protein
MLAKVDLNGYLATLLIGQKLNAGRDIFSGLRRTETVVI